MAKDMFWTTVTFGIIFGVLALAFWPTHKGSVVVIKYDCHQLIDGSHSDIPTAVQEECRKKGLVK